MKFAQTVVSENGFRDVTHTADRLKALAELLRGLADDGIDLLTLPAGYLSVTRESGVAAVVSEVADLAKQTGLTVAGGVDVIGGHGKATPAVEGLVRAGRLPFFGFAVSPASESDKIPLWRQASVTNGDARLAPDDGLPGPDRLVPGLGVKVAILLCGELFNRRAREAVAAAEPELIVDLAHARMGQGLIPAMKNLAGLAGCPVAHCQHLAGWSGRSLHFVTGTGTQESMPTDQSPLHGDEAFWIGWCVRAV